MATSSPCCCLCSANLAVANRSRIISPVSEANADAHEFFTAFVRPGYRFGEELHYVCRTPCFSDLAKAVKHYVALEQLLLAFGAPARLRNTPLSDASTQTPDATTTPHFSAAVVETTPRTPPTGGPPPTALGLLCGPFSSSLEGSVSSAVPPSTCESQESCEEVSQLQ